MTLRVGRAGSLTEIAPPRNSGRSGGLGNFRSAELTKSLIYFTSCNQNETMFCCARKNFNREEIMLMRCLKTLCVGAAMGAASLLAGAAHAEGWMPSGTWGLHIRNNSLSTFTVSVANTKRESSCAVSDYSYPNGTSTTLEPASMKLILDTDGSWCQGSGTAWKVTLQQSGVGTSSANIPLR
jgi:hypothetical protein